jgi:ribosomal protein L37AE/L43A
MICAVCDNNFKPRQKNQIYCCRKCNRIGSHRKNSKARYEKYFRSLGLKHIVRHK